MVKWKKIIWLNMFRLCFGFGLFMAGAIRYLMAGPMSKMSLDELGSILLLVTVGIYFMHSSMISDLTERIKELERKLRVK